MASTMKLAIVSILSLLTLPTAYCQASANTVLVDALIKHWQSSKELTLAVANAMPEDGYSFKATPAEMSFGGQMNHIAQGDGHYCSAAFGDKAGMDKPADDTKATAVKSLETAFDYCISGIKKMTDADLEHTIDMRGKPISKFELIWGGFTHTAHHRGQAEVYLRLKGITPPDYKF